MLLELIIPTLIVRAVVARIVLAHTLIQLVGASRDKLCRTNDLGMVDVASATASASAASAACAALTSSEYAEYAAKTARAKTARADTPPPTEEVDDYERV